MSRDPVGGGVLWGSLGGLETLTVIHGEPEGSVQCLLYYWREVTFSCRAEKSNLNSLFLMKIGRRFSEMADGLKTRLVLNMKYFCAKDGQM